MHTVILLGLNRSSPPPDEYAEDTELFEKLIRNNSKIEVKTLLHLGCGAGNNDYTFKRHFKVTGVDISEDMLEIAKNYNPEVNYICADIREIKLKECFDAVAIPDCISYMKTKSYLRKLINGACRLLKPGGVLLIVAHTSEEFMENDFVYTGCKGDIEITIFENNYILDSARTAYEATFIYLIRRAGELQMHIDRHTLGIFKEMTWLSLLENVGLTINQMKMEHTYDRFILGEGEYPLSMFICCKPL